MLAARWPPTGRSLFVKCPYREFQFIDFRIRRAMEQAEREESLRPWPPARVKSRAAATIRWRFCEIGIEVFH
jgi:hypothetical protein